MGYWFKKHYIEFFPNPTKEGTIIMPLLSSLIMLGIANKHVISRYRESEYIDPSLSLVSHKFAHFISFLFLIPVIYVCIRSDSACHSNKIC